MYALHALWRADGQLALWAENATGYPGAGRPAGGTAPRAHPYAGPAGEVAAVLGGIGPGLGWLAGRAPERWATLPLPTVGAVPAPSPDLPVTAPRGGATLQPWRVPALLFAPAEAAQLLGEIFDPHWAVTSAELPGTGRVDVVHGSSLRWFTAVHDLAWRLVGRGRLLPVPVLEHGTPHARWRPDPGPADRREAAALAAGCPPVCRAGTTGEELTGTVLAALVDAEARAALAGTALLPAGTAGAAGRWFTALTTAEAGLPPAPAQKPNRAPETPAPSATASPESPPTPVRGPHRTPSAAPPVPVRGPHRTPSAAPPALMRGPHRTPSAAPPALMRGPHRTPFAASPAPAPSSPAPEVDGSDFSRRIEAAESAREVDPADFSRQEPPTSARPAPSGVDSAGLAPEVGPADFSCEGMPASGARNASPGDVSPVPAPEVGGSDFLRGGPFGHSEEIAALSGSAVVGSADFSRQQASGQPAPAPEVGGSDFLCGNSPVVGEVGVSSGAAASASAREVGPFDFPHGGLPAVGEGDAEFAEFRRRVAEWYGRGEAASGVLRVCFRLLEPLGPDPEDPVGQPSDDHWQVELLVQAVDEPSLLVRAAELHEGGAALAALARKAGDREAVLDVLTAEVARAAYRWPELDGLRHRARPAVVGLDRAGALEFLRTAAPALAESGFGVLLPSWWRRRPRLGLALQAAAAPVPGALAIAAQVDRDAVVAFRWQAALGEDGDPLTEQELADLAAAKQGLVRVRGRWLEADPAQIAAALAFLARHRDGVLDTPQLLRLALDPEAAVAGLPVTSVRIDGPLGDLLAGRAAPSDQPARLPADFGTTLRPYQERGVAWLRSLAGLGLGGVLADDMGLGKTVQTLALLAAEQAEGAAGPNLLVCPMSLVGNWQREAERFAPGLRLHVHHGGDRVGAEELRDLAGETDLVVTTYGLVQRDLAALRTIRWRRVIADEAQHIKNLGTAQSRAIRTLPVAVHRIALTGTPVENRLAELHSVLDFANPGLFGSAERFKERYAIPVELHANPERTAELQRRTRPFVLRRLKSDPAVAAELPAKQEITVRCHLTAEQAGLYQAVVADLLHRVRGVKGVERRGTVLAAIGKLKQVCNHPAQLLHDGSELADRSGKVGRLEELLAEALAEGDRVLVFTQYAEFGALLQPHLARRLGEEVLYLHGGVPRARREELVQRFQSPGGPRVFLLSLRAGGTGLNLTAANQVIHLDRWWNPAVEQQATDRAFRIGQRRDVQVRRLVCVGTVEDRIDELLTTKRALAETVVGEGEHWLTELSAAQLGELVALSKDAIADEEEER